MSILPKINTQMPQSSITKKTNFCYQDKMNKPVFEKFLNAKKEQFLSKKSEKLTEKDILNEYKGESHHNKENDSSVFYLGDHLDDLNINSIQDEDSFEALNSSVSYHVLFNSIKTLETDGHENISQLSSSEFLMILDKVLQEKDSTIGNSDKSLHFKLQDKAMPPIDVSLSKNSLGAWNIYLGLSSSNNGALHNYLNRLREKIEQKGHVVDHLDIVIDDADKKSYQIVNRDK